MKRKETNNTRKANSTELAFCGWTKEQVCITCGNYPVVVDHFYGSTFKHNELIGHYALLPLCLHCDSYHTLGSKRGFMNKFGSAAKLILQNMRSSPYEPPNDVIKALWELMISQLQVYEGYTMYYVEVKPLSVNECYGRNKAGQDRHKTAKYKAYEKDVLKLLPRDVKVGKGPLQVIYEFGVSNYGCDTDNPVKPFQDILAKGYGFNDNIIECYFAHKVKVQKGGEYVGFMFFEDKELSMLVAPLMPRD